MNPRKVLPKAISRMPERSCSVWRPTENWNSSMYRGKLTVVGAGPGDVELITLKGVKALASADVVLYDALVSRELLEHAPKAEKIFVGKRKGCSAYGQEQINELLVQRAQQGL